jgi:hypothetical protein
VNGCSDEAAPQYQKTVGRRQRAYFVEKIPNWDFWNFRQKHILVKTLRGLPCGVPKRRAGAGSSF